LIWQCAQKYPADPVYPEAHADALRAGSMCTSEARHCSIFNKKVHQLDDGNLFKGLQKLLLYRSFNDFMSCGFASAIVAIIIA